MWKPSEDYSWKLAALCAKPEYKYAKSWFFSKIPREKYDAKNICFSCPARKECIQWALENKQIWGVWGGKDEVELRRALSVSYRGEEARRLRFPNCPYCGARPSKLSAETAEVPGGGRWTIVKIVVCTSCNFSWRSRTSYNAVISYKNDRKQKEEKKVKERERKALIKIKALAKTKGRKKLSSS